MGSFSLVAFAVGVLFFVAALSSPGVSPADVFRIYVGSCIGLALLARCSASLVAMVADVLAFVDRLADDG